MEKENLSKIWPVFYLSADWSQNIYECFDLGIKLIRIDENCRNMMDNILPNSCYDIRSELKKANWLLAVNLPQAIQHVPINDINMSFENEVQEVIIASFLMCLRIIHQTNAICPIQFEANITPDGIDATSISEASCDYYYANSFFLSGQYVPIWNWFERFKESDLQLLTDLWSAIVKLRKLDFWAKVVFKEEFFADLDKKSVENIEKEIRESLLSACSFAVENSPEFKEALCSFAENICSWKKEGREEEFVKEAWQESYSKLLRYHFIKKQEEISSARTRIGRALNLFDESLFLSKLHAFLSMCLVLETIFTVEEAEITYQFATRLANITGKTLEQRKDIFKRARNVYNERSNIVHGRRSIETVDPDILKDAFFFARQSLLHILLDSKLLALYSDPITIDKTKISGKAAEAIKDYFRDLDLR